MDDLTVVVFVVFVIALVLALITVAGHGMWVLMASMFGRHRSPGPTLPPVPGWPGGDARAALRHIDDLYAAGRIDPPSYQRVRQAIQDGLSMPESRGAFPLDAPPPIPVAAVAVESRPADAPGPVATSPDSRDWLHEVAARKRGESSEDTAVAPVEPLPAAEPLPPAETPPVPVPQALTQHRVPPTPRRSLSQVFGAFMEARNIRWGELIGGLLIVGCSVALVLSLWSEISQRPVLKFTLFTAVTAAMFGAGLYTEHRWKLPLTSRGLLLIAALLVPLNVLAIGPVGGTSTVMLLGEIASAGAIAAMLWAAGRVVTPRWPVLLAIGVLGPSSAESLIRRMIVDSGSDVALMGLLSAGLMAGPLLLALWSLRREERLTQARAGEWFTLLGASSFAAVVCMGLLAYRTGHPMWAMGRLSPLVALMGAPVLAGGLVIWRRPGAELHPSSLPDYMGMQQDAGFLSAGVRTAAAAVGSLGVAVMLCAVALAWPDVRLVVLVCAVNVVVFAALAWAEDLPEAHVPAGFCLLIGFVLGYHWWAGRVSVASTESAVLRAVASASTGMALLPLTAAAGALSIVLRRSGRGGHAMWIGRLAAAAGTLGVAALTAYGIGRTDDGGAAGGLAAYAALAVAAAISGASLFWVLAAAAVLAVSLYQALVVKLAGPWALTQPVQWALLVHPSICLAGAILMTAAQRVRPLVKLAEALTVVAAAVALVAGAAICAGMGEASSRTSAVRVLWVAAIWTVCAIRGNWPLVMFAAQAAFTLAGIVAVRSQIPGRAIEDPRSLASLGGAAAWVGLVFTAIRLSLRKRGGAIAQRLAGVLAPDGLALDRILLPVLAAGAVVIAVLAAVPGVWAELAVVGQAGAGPISDDFAAAAAGAGQWLFMAVVATALVVGLWERFQVAAVWVWGVAAVALSSLFPLAAGFMPENSTASSLRWLAGAPLLAGCVLAWLAHRLTRMREHLANLPTMLGLPASDGPAVWTGLRQLLLMLALLVLALTIWPATVRLSGQTIVGPADGSFFGRIGAGLSYVPPLVAVSLSLILLGLRERAAGYTFAAGLVANLTVSLAYLLEQSTLGPTQWITLIQANAIAGGLFALAWLLFCVITSSTPPALGVLAGLAASLNVLLLSPALIWLVIGAAGPDAALGVVGSHFGWLALAAPLAALMLNGALAGRGVHVGLIAAGVTGASVLAAGLASRADTGNWLAYHVLLGALLCTGLSILLFGWLVLERGRSSASSDLPLPSPLFGPPQRREIITGWVMATAVLVATISLRSVIGDPRWPWWTVGAIGGSASLFVLLGAWLLRSGPLYAAAALVNLAASIFAVAWLRVGSLEFLEVNIIALGAPCVLWMLLCVLVFNPPGAPAGRYAPLAIHRLGAILALAGMALVVSIGLASDFAGNPYGGAAVYAWLAFAAAAAAMLACLWDAAARFAVGGLYVLGLVLAGLVIDRFDLPPTWGIWLGISVLAAYVLMTSSLWSMRDAVGRVAMAAGIPHAATRRAIIDSGEIAFLPAPWLLIANSLLAISVCVLGYWVVLTFGFRSHRLTTALAVAAQSIAVGLLARGQRRSAMQSLALSLASAGVVAFGWAWLNVPKSPWAMNHAVVAMAALAGLMAVFGLGLGKLVRPLEQWTDAARRMLPPVLVLLAGSVVATLLMEFRQSSDGLLLAVPIRLAVAATLTAIAAMGIIAAVVPGRDPFNLPDQRRTIYVYSAEGVLAILGVHMRLAWPRLFELGIWDRFWPLIILGIAFAGVGLAEIFRRQNRPVLAVPLERTGAMLPLLPILGFLLIKHHAVVDYSHVLFLSALIYGSAALMRRSVLLGVLAVLAANAGLWAVLNGSASLRIDQHPQLWLIPPALCLLAGAHLNRHRLSAEQLAAARYAAMAVIYVSSTPDIFLVGVQRSPWLPLVLCGLSVAGVLLGIMLRVRSFLVLGTAFLLLSIITMIWHASADLGWTWLWWAAGIVLGILIVTMFALFEKKREEMLKLVDGLKQWER